MRIHSARTGAQSPPVGGHGAEGGRAVISVWVGAALKRRLAWATGALLSLVLIVLPGHAPATQPTVFHEAEFFWSGGDWQPPAEGTPWQRVALPHRWHSTHPGKAGYGWYRIEFDLEDAPTWVQAIQLNDARSWWVDFFVNDTLVGSSRDLASGDGLRLNTPVFFTFPSSLLRPGRNVIVARMAAWHAVLNIQGLGRVTLGDAPSVHIRSVVAQEWGVYAERSLIAMTFAAGIISLFIWLARRSDRVLLWYAIACLSWAAAGALWHALRWTSDIRFLHYVLTSYWFYGLAVPAVVLALRLVGVRRPLFESALWLFLLAEVVWPVLGYQWTSLEYLNIKYLMVRLLAQDLINGALLAAGAALVLQATWRRRRWPDLVAALSLGVMAALMFYEATRYFGWIDVEAPYLRPYHVPVLVFAIGAAIFDRHVRAIWRMQRSNVELQRRVDEKAREIEAYHAEREDQLRQEALIRDRQRILADMHDGLGASLISLLRYAQGGAPDARGLELRVREALQELRIAIDALEPAEGDLGSVLGKLRYRIEPLVESSGARLGWDAEELPAVEALDPSAVFSIQRILLEAVSNAIQHGGAQHIDIAARANGSDAISITVQDDGAGFDPRQPSAGLGLANMRRRAEGIGAGLDIASRPGSGTTLTLSVPRRLAQPVPTTYPEAAALSRA
jgi:signal transduction histidine kinase